MFEKLRGLVSDNPEALKLIDAAEQSATKNVQTINDLETTVAAVKQTRDQYKSGNALVKSILGVDAVNEETIKEALKTLKGSGKGDEASKAEIENLQKLLKEAEDERTNLTQDYEGQLQSMALEQAIAGSGIAGSAANEEMFEILTTLVKTGATFEDSKVVYKNEDGSTIYGEDKQPLDIAGKVGQLKANPSYAGMFKVDVNPGTGTPAKAGGVNNPGNAGMSSTEMMKAGRRT